jgi:hypothetical protein
MFPTRYTTIARHLGSQVSDLWLDEKLTPRRVRNLIRTYCNERNLSANILSGAYRTTLILPSGVIKLPHDETAVKSTALEGKMFEIIRTNRKLAKHFPVSRVVYTHGIPVVIQEKVEQIATDSIDEIHPMVLMGDLDEKNPVHLVVEEFAHKMGLGDVHLGNYGWKENTRGYYPVFFDCELVPNGDDLSLSYARKIANSTAKWQFYL